MVFTQWLTIFPLQFLHLQWSQQPRPRTWSMPVLMLWESAWAAAPSASHRKVVTLCFSLPSPGHSRNMFFSFNISDWTSICHYETFCQIKRRREAHVKNTNLTNYPVQHFAGWEMWAIATDLSDVCDMLPMLRLLNPKLQHNARLW